MQLKHKGNNMKKCIVFLTIVSLIISVWIVSSALAAEFAAKTLVIPFNGETAVTVVFRDLNNGNLIDADDGTSTAATAWGDAEIEATQHAESNDWLIAVPTTSVRTAYFSVFHSAASAVTKTSVPDKSAVLYDVESGRTFTDTTLSRLK